MHVSSSIDVFSSNCVHQLTVLTATVQCPLSWASLQPCNCTRRLASQVARWLRAAPWQCRPPWTSACGVPPRCQSYRRRHTTIARLSGVLLECARSGGASCFSSSRCILLALSQWSLTSGHTLQATPTSSLSLQLLSLSRRARCPCSISQSRRRGWVCLVACYAA